MVVAAGLRDETWGSYRSSPCSSSLSHPSPQPLKGSFHPYSHSFPHDLGSQATTLPLDWTLNQPNLPKHTDLFPISSHSLRKVASTKATEAQSCCCVKACQAECWQHRPYSVAPLWLTRECGHCQTWLQIGGSYLGWELCAGASTPVHGWGTQKGGWVEPAGVVGEAALPCRETQQ